MYSSFCLCTYMYVDLHKIWREVSRYFKNFVSVTLILIKLIYRSIQAFAH